MFNLQGSEIVIILLLALVVLGPEKLPDAMRKMGQFYAELRKMSSGFQQEFRAAIDEPAREIRETANTLRDSADLTKLQNGERDEKPKSAEMADLGDPRPEPSPDIPTFEAADGAEPERAPVASDDSVDAPFDDVEATEPPEPAGPTEIPQPPAPFTGMSSAAPREGDDAPADDEATVPPEPDQADPNDPTDVAVDSEASDDLDGTTNRAT